MNNALGSAGVLLGFLGSVVGGAVVLVGLLRDRPQLRRQAFAYGLLVLAGAVLATVAMERALITRDFTVLFVAENGSTRTPMLFNIATLWSALEGSIILWALVLAGYVTAVLVKFRDRLDDPLVGWAVLTLFVVTAFFFALMVGPADPFRSFDPPPGYDGPGPNPLLQNHLLMAFHPPMLYLGYVGFTVPFAFAIGALATGRVGEGWLLETRRWTLIAWGFLTVGIVLGAWWSYEVLGWGGYWGWDPVENASFLPWLTGTAYLHSVMVQERRGMLRVWNLSLLCATFALTILGTFLTRSGVLDSVHAFTESGIGPAFLGFFGLIVAVSVVLIGWRGDRLRAPGRIDSPLSREGAFFGNNLLFAGFAFMVLLGTLFPLLVEAVNGDRISVGVPYFDRMATPLGLAILALMAVAPVLPWRKASGSLLRERLFWPAWAGTAAVVVAVLVGARGVVPLVTFGLAGLAAGAAVRQLVLAVRRHRWAGLVGRANGGMVVHIGVVILAVGLAASGSYATTGEFRLGEGDSAELGGHRVTYLGLETLERPERTQIRARVQVDDDGVFTPSLSEYRFGGQTIGTPSVRVGLTNDVYLALQALPEEGSDEVLVRVVVQPMIIWLWVGGIVMGLGTILAAWPGSRRRPTDPTSVVLADEAAAGAPTVAAGGPDRAGGHDDERAPTPAGAP